MHAPFYPALPIVTNVFILLPFHCMHVPKIVVVVVAGGGSVDKSSSVNYIQISIYRVKISPHAKI